VLLPNASQSLARCDAQAAFLLVPPQTSTALVLYGRQQLVQPNINLDIGLHQFSKDSQFIVVTHNKATMTAVDTIYGVYMPEPGVSSVTPVDFRALGHEAMVFEAG